MSKTPIPKSEFLQKFCSKNNMQEIQFKKLKHFNKKIFDVFKWIPIPYLFTVLNNWTDFNFEIYLCTAEADFLEEAELIFIKDVNGTVTKEIFRKEPLYFDSESPICEYFTFTFFNVRYIYDPETKFLMNVAQKINNLPFKEFKKKYEFGRSETEIPALLNTFKKNEIMIAKPSVKEILVGEIFSLMGFLEIIFLYFVWYDGAVFYMMFLIVLAVYSKTVAVKDAFENYQSIKEYLSSGKETIVLRKNIDGGNSKFSIKSEELVPGDVIELTTNLEITADLILLSGSCVIDDQNITGFSQNSIKYAINPNDFPDDLIISKLSSTCFINAGSTCVNTRTLFNSIAIALVVKTGFNTNKGAVLRNLLLPHKEKFKFFDEAIRWVWISVIFWVVSSIIYLYMQTFLMKKISISFKDGLIKVGELFFATVKPVIPFCLFMALENSKKRLEAKNLISFNKYKINTCGKVKTVFMDKTGTMTSDSSEINSFHVCVGFMREILAAEKQSNNGNFLFDSNVSVQNNKTKARLSAISDINAEEFQNEYVQFQINHLKNPISSSKAIEKIQEGCYFLKNTNNVDDLIKLGKETHEFIQCLAFCNNIVKVGNKMIGEEIDVQLLQKSPFFLNYDLKLENNELVKKYLLLDKYKRKLKISSSFEVVKIFEFTNEKKRMGVVLRDSENNLIFVCKGAPEEIENICMEESVPEEFQKKLYEICSQGSRMLALSYRKLKKGENFEKREEIESNMMFCGFYSLKDPVKSTTPRIIRELTSNLIKCMMITGDNIFSAIHVGYECGMIPRDKHFYFGEKIIRKNKQAFYWIKFDLNETHETHKSIFEKINLKGRVSELDSKRIVKNIEDLYNEKENVVIGLNANSYQFLMELIKTTKFENAEKYLAFIHTNCLIYGRANCHEKRLIIENYKKFTDNVNPILFVGDGDNDSEAIKVADVSLMLRKSQLSFSAAFSSTDGDLNCILDLIREGKCSLENGIQSFKFFVLLTACQYVANFLLYLAYIGFNSLENVFVDAFVVMFFTGYISSFNPKTQSTPHIPKVSITDKKLLFSVISHCVFASIVIVISYHQFQKLPFYKNSYDIVTAEDKQNFSIVLDKYYFYDNHFLFCIINLIFVINFVFTNYSGNFRQPFLENKGSVIYIICFVSFFIFFCQIGESSDESFLVNVLIEHFRIMKTFDSGKVYLFAAAFYSFCALLIEKATDLLFFVYYRNKFNREKENFLQTNSMEYNLL